MSKYDSQLQFDKVDSAWVIRAGEGGSADSYFMNKHVIVLKDQGLRNLSQIEPTRQAFYDAYGSIKPYETHKAITGIGGKFYRFVHEMQIGDIVLYPSLKMREIFYGKITGKYQYVLKDKDYPHQRKVQWITSFPKSSLSKAAQYELGSARTLFKYSKNISELLYKIRNAHSSE